MAARNRVTGTGLIRVLGPHDRWFRGLTIGEQQVPGGLVERLREGLILLAGGGNFGLAGHLGKVRPDEIIPFTAALVIAKIRASDHPDGLTVLIDDEGDVAPATIPLLLPEEVPP